MITEIWFASYANHLPIDTKENLEQHYLLVGEMYSYCIFGHNGVIKIKILMAKKKMDND